MLVDLDTQTCNVYSSLPPQYRSFDGRNCVSESDFNEIISLQAVYHLCRIVPHLEMVRYLQLQDPLAKAHIQRCSRIAVRHINQISDIFRNAIPTLYSFRSALPPFVAYCSLVSSSVYFKYLDGIQNRREDSDNYENIALQLVRARLIPNLHLLNQLSSFWAPVKAMVGNN